jgi:SAM-dependent methyltransferase
MDKPNVTPERLMQFAWGYAAPLMIEAALKIRLFDVLDEGPKDLRALAAATKASERGVRALADALVGLQLLSKKGDAYALAPESAAFLVSTRPAFHGGIFHHMSSQSVPHWLHVAEAVKTGRPVSAVNDPKDGAGFFQDLVEAIFPMSYAAAQAAVRELRVSEAKAPYSVLDIAAGSGVWGIAFAQASPQVRVTAVDWEGVIPVTRRVAARFGVADRFTFVAGDIANADFGKGHRAATLGHILHSEGAAKSRKLLRRVFDALAPGGTIVVAEFVPDDDRCGPPTPLIFGVNMLLHTDVGDVFTWKEIGGWLAEAGFKNARRLEAPAPSPLILATKP